MVIELAIAPTVDMFLLLILSDLEVDGRVLLVSREIYNRDLTEDSPRNSGVSEQSPLGQSREM